MTPIRRQYLRIKQKYPHAILFFRMGDFYETFDEDAKVAARELEIALTSRPMGKNLRVPLAGIPYHALDSYLARLISRGYKVAICEQMGDPKAAKGLVEREVVRVVTPGTVVEPTLLDSKTNNHLVALAWGEKEAGLAHVDITTGEFATTQLSHGSAWGELSRLAPAEVLVPKGMELGDSSMPFVVTPVDDGWFEPEEAQRILTEHFGVATLDGYGCGHLPQAMAAAGAIIRYLEENQRVPLSYLTRLFTYSLDSFMTLDPQTRKNLELFQSIRTGAARGSLLSVVDFTRTAMGGRTLRRWLGQPLLDVEELERRLDGVEWLFSRGGVRGEVLGLLGQIADLERLANRAQGGIATPRDLVALRRTLELIPKLKAIFGCEEGGPSEHPLEGFVGELKPCDDVVHLLREALTDDPQSALGGGEGGVIKEGFSEELDTLRKASRDAHHFIAQLERQERGRTGIKSLKVGYNKVFGYYIEVSNANRSQVPADYIRRQTLVGGERYFTAQLKEYESTILNAQDRMEELESALFRQVCAQVAAYGETLLAQGMALAHLDVFAALAEAAARYAYVRPQLNRGEEILIAGGRHPVVERSLDEGAFVPNDTYLSNRDTQVAVITGPNMSGKSTYLRQVALIVLMAQIGSFVPATSATIGLVDRVFTRVGAQEDLAAGQSTFMVEMVETANILNHATLRSLMVFDEIGRGTSTYDGIAIAKAVVEFIHNHPRLGGKTLFATHYHELVELARELPRVRNFNLAVAEEGGKVVFLRKILPGGADRSYGIHVAQLAGLPSPVIHRAQEVLGELEGQRSAEGKGHREARKPPAGWQISFFGERSPVLEELAGLDIPSMTPLEAINRLYELQQKAKEA